MTVRGRLSTAEIVRLMTGAGDAVTVTQVAHSRNPPTPLELAIAQLTLIEARLAGLRTHSMPPSVLAIRQIVEDVRVVRRMLKALIIT